MRTWAFTSPETGAPESGSRQPPGLSEETLGLRAKDILFVSSNWWDAWGAKAFGYNVCWCNRPNARMEFSDHAPDLVVTGLGQIADLLAG